MSLRRFWTVCSLDLRHALRRPLYWIWGVLVFLCAMGFSDGGLQISSGDSSTGGIKAHITSSYANALEFALLGGLFYTFFVAAAAGMGVIRDQEQRVEGLLHSTPLRASEYVWGKFTAALVGSLVILGVQLAVSMFFKQLVTPSETPEIIGDFDPLFYLQPALIFSVPLIVLMAGVAFAIGERSRRPVLVNMFPLVVLLLCIFILWMWTPSWLDPRVNRALMLVDPTGFRWLQQTWLDVDLGAEFYNDSLIGFDLGFFLSRLVMVGVGLGCVFLSQGHLARSMRGARVSERDVRAALEDAPSGGARQPRERSPLAELGMKRKRPSALKALYEIVRVELGLLRGHPGVWLFLPLLVLNTTFDAIYSVGAFDTLLLVTPGSSAVGSLTELTFTLCLLLTVFTVEGLRREQSVGLAPILYSTPVSTRTLVFGKLVATSVLGAAVAFAVFLVCAVILLIRGTVALEVEPYLVVYGLLLMPVVFFWNALVALVYALTRNRFATYAIMISLMIWTGIELALGNMSWTWNWSLAGALQWTDLGPFEMDRTPLILNRVMACTAALFLFVLAARVFPRRGFDPTRVLLRLRPGALGKTALWLSPLLVVPIALGIALSRGVNAGSDGARNERWAKAYWSKNVRTWLDGRDPELAGVELELELEPAQRWLRSRGSLLLRNPHGESLERFALTGAPHWEETSWELNDEDFEPDEREGLFVFELDEPLQPEATLSVSFAFEGKVHDGYSENGADYMEFILASGVVLTSFGPSFMPLVGYREGIGVDEDNSYDSKEFADDFFEGVTRAGFGASLPYPTKVTITAPEAYTMNSVGVLTGSSVEHGRKTWVWESDHPVHFLNVVGGLWDVRRGEGTAVFHHPAHTYNLDEMIAALDGARRHYSEWFFPYPWQDLRLSEFAAYAGYAQGFPTNITFSERIGFLTADDEETSTAFMVTAHEAAHQWWGNLLMPGDGPGGNLLSEGTAHFSTMLLFEAVKGDAARREFCKRIEETYNASRVVDSERELVKIDGSRDGDTTVTYDKMGWVTWMMLEELGRERGLAGLRAFFERYVTNRDHPVLQDFVAHMREFATDVPAYDAFVEQWFFDVVLPEYALEEVELVEASSEGAQRELRFTLHNRGTARMSVVVAAERGERAPRESEEDADEEDLTPFEEARVEATLGADERVELVIPCSFEPEVLRVDPDVMVLQRGRAAALHRL